MFRSFHSSDIDTNPIDIKGGTMNSSMSNPNSFTAGDTASNVVATNKNDDIYAPRPLSIYGGTIKIVDHIKLPVHDNLLHELFFDDKYKHWWKQSDDSVNSSHHRFNSFPRSFSSPHHHDDEEEEGQQKLFNISLSSSPAATEIKPNNTNTTIAATFPQLLEPITLDDASNLVVTNYGNEITFDKTLQLLGEEEIPMNPAISSTPSSYYDQQWQNRFKELCEFRSHHGHCLVPYLYKDNLSLGEWVKRQRYHFRMRKKNKKTILTDERIAMLNKIGFVWDSHDSAWNVRFVELCAFMKDNGHFNVPAKSSKNYKQLANWASRQRRLKKLHLEGTVMNERDLMRIQKLESIGFFM